MTTTAPATTPITPTAAATPAAAPVAVKSTAASKPAKVATAPKKAAAAKPAAAPKTTAKAPAAKPAATTKPAPKATAKPKAAAPAESKPAAKPAAPAKETKVKKPKLVRDSFTIPKDEYAVVETLKQRAAALAQPAKKSELLRAGLKLLATLSDTALRSALQAVPSIKTGRPKADAPAAKNSRK